MHPVNRGLCTSETQSRGAARALGELPLVSVIAVLDALIGARPAPRGHEAAIRSRSRREQRGCRLATCPGLCDGGSLQLQVTLSLSSLSRVPAGFWSGRPGAEPVLSTRHGREGHGPGLRAGKDLAAVTCRCGGSGPRFSAEAAAGGSHRQRPPGLRCSVVLRTWGGKAASWARFTKDRLPLWA